MIDLTEAIDILEDIENDADISKSVKLRIIEIKKDLSSTKSSDISLAINKALNDIEEISFDANLQPFIWPKLTHLSCVLEDLS